MCTVSVLRLPGDLLRVACNRDEQETRAAALPPVVRRVGGRRAVMPIDPVSGGTWIAANDAGVVLALLNFNRPGSSDTPAPRSRGVIIPSLLGEASVWAVVGRARSLSPASFGPFRLAVLDRTDGAEVVSDGRTLCVRRVGGDGDAATLFTSSGLGDHLVRRPRTELFERMLAAEVSAATQNAFHRHAWADRPHLSVRMRRDGARTVSTTVVEVSAEGIEMSYRPEDAAAFPDAVSLAAGGVPCG